MRYRIVTVHGEARSLFHVLDTIAPEGEQPAIVASFESREYAECLRDWANIGAAVVTADDWRDRQK